MSKIKAEIESAMTDLKKDGETFTSRFVFSPEFAGFQGHFPMKQVLPGACQIQCALTTIEKVHDKSVGVRKILLAKYYAPVFPNEEITCSISMITDEETESTCKALITKDGAKATELKLRVFFKGPKKQRLL